MGKKKNKSNNKMKKLHRLKEQDYKDLLKNKSINTYYDVDNEIFINKKDLHNYDKDIYMVIEDIRIVGLKQHIEEILNNKPKLKQPMCIELSEQLQCYKYYKSIITRPYYIKHISASLQVDQPDIGSCVMITNNKTGSKNFYVVVEISIKKGEFNYQFDNSDNYGIIDTVGIRKIISIKNDKIYYECDINTKYISLDENGVWDLNNKDDRLVWLSLKNLNHYFK